MAERENSGLKPDIVIVGAGIAGLWLLARLKTLGYDVLLLERSGIGGTQTLASQGIIHSGLKYAIAGQVSTLAREISAMPDVWRRCLAGNGPIDLRGARLNAESQIMLIPPGFGGELIKLAAQKALGTKARSLQPEEWPEDLKRSGFKGATLMMDEPVLDIPSAVRALATPHLDCIRLINKPTLNQTLSDYNIAPKLMIFTAATGNDDLAAELGDTAQMETRRRPLLMGMLKPAPFDIFAHLIGASEKPVATITTHYTTRGERVWYIGGLVAEREKNAPPADVFKAAREALLKYCPALDLSDLRWAALPIDRSEGKPGASQGWMPDTPVIQACVNRLYCWPTKLTFAPLLSNRIENHLKSIGLEPSHTESDFSTLPPCPFASAPWENAKWTD